MPAQKRITIRYKRGLAARCKQLARHRLRKTGYKSSRQGYLKIVRKQPEFWVANTGLGTVGIRSVVQTAAPGTEGAYIGTALFLGTPTAGMNGSSDIPFAMQFRLDDLINSADITTIADKYRIKAAYIRIIPNFTMNSVQSQYNYPSLQYIRDDDDVTPPTVQTLREKMGVKNKTFKPGQYVGIKVPFPKFQSSTLNGAGTNSNANMRTGWLDCQNPTIPHFGIKGCFMNMDLPATTTAKISFKFDVALVVEAKDFQ